MQDEKLVGLLTIDPQIYNYGGMLQEYALYRTIEEMGYKCELINYDPSNEYHTFSYKRDIRNVTFEKIVEKARLHKIKSRVNLNSVDIANILSERYKLFDSFRKRINISERLSRDQLISLQNRYSGIVCGSDQIWNPDYNIPAFFLDFVKPPVKPVIYAASIGKAQLTKHQIETYAVLMKPLDAISVREKSAIELLEKYVKHTQMELVLDPTLLLKKEEWISLAKEAKDYPSKYVFCYFLENNAQKSRAALSFSKRVGCNLVSVPYLHGVYNEMDCGLGDISRPVGPLEFLNYILNAEYVLTDSFHASVFSILFDKNFRVFGRKSGSYNMNTRIETLLSYFDLCQCMIDTEKLELGMPYLSANKNMFDSIKKSSLKFLRDALE